MHVRVIDTKKESKMSSSGENFQDFIKILTKIHLTEAREFLHVYTDLPRVQ